MNNLNEDEIDYIIKILHREINKIKYLDKNKDDNIIKSIIYKIINYKINILMGKLND